MFTRSVAVVINRPQDEVFSYVADARNRPSWDASVTSEELTSPEPIGVGSTVRTRFPSMGRTIEYTWKVTEHQPPSRMVIESTSGPFPTTLTYQLSTSEGGTRVEFSITGRPGGIMRVLQQLLARQAQGNLDRAFPRLKRLLEGTPAA